MKKFISFGKIPQFRSIIKDVQRTAQFIGIDEDTGHPIYDKNKRLPVLIAKGTEKIHGTNAGFVYNEKDGFWCQSRKNIISTTTNDNAGCALFMEKRSNILINIIKELAEYHNIDLNEFGIALYGEWAGGNIQKNSCLTGVSKRFVIFKYAKVFKIEDDNEENFSNYWIDTIGLKNEDNLIFNVTQFKEFELEVDFNNPGIANNKMIEVTKEIEENSIIANYFNKNDNIGEGLVWYIKDTDGNILSFKTKGEKHAGKSKVKTLKVVDNELINKQNKFATEIACTTSRLEQKWQETFGIENEIKEPTVKETGTFLRKIINDVWEEELDVFYDFFEKEIKENKIEQRNLNSVISKVARMWFMDKLNSDF